MTRYLPTLLLLAALPLGHARGDDWPIRFTDAAASSRVKQHLAGMMGHGGAIGDFDGDGRLDLFAGGFSDRPDSEYAPAKGPVPSRLLRQTEGFFFEPVEQPAVAFHARISGAVFADFDNDGRPELFVANNARPRTGKTDEPQRSAQLRRSALLQYKDGQWRDITAAANACPDALLSARNIGVFDYDNDGLLDLLIIEDRFVGRAGSHTSLLRNVTDKDGIKFVDVTERVGLPDGVYGLGHAVADLNADGRPDFFIAHSNRMFLSTDEGKYVESPLLTKVFAWQPLDGEDWPCGAAFGDLDRDGDLDLVLGIHSVRARNRVYLNEGMHRGAPLFRDATAECGLDAIVPVKCPHVEVQDFDNDGWPDIYFSAAWKFEDGRVEPLIYRNLGVKNGVPRFETPRKVGDGDGMKMVYYAAGPTADLNLDGRRDIFLINWFQGDHSHLLRNNSSGGGTPGNWLTVRVEGRAPTPGATTGGGGKLNRMGIGASVRIYRENGQFGRKSLLGYQQVQIGYGYASGQDAACHFGLGDADKVDIRVILPDGRVIEKIGVRGNRVVTVEEAGR